MDKENLEQIKKQLIEHIERTFPPGKKFPMIQQIKAMNDSQFMEFLIKNKLIADENYGDINVSEKPKCIFCSIIDNELPSYKIAENETAVAVLEINPISKGHLLVIPKEHITASESLPREIYSFAEKLAEKIKLELNPKDITIASQKILGHELLNVIPVYDDETIESKRSKISEEELSELQQLLTSPSVKKEKIKEEKQEIKVIEEKIEEINEKNTWLPRRKP